MSLTAKHPRSFGDLKTLNENTMTVKEIKVLTGPISTIKALIVEKLDFYKATELRVPISPWSSHIHWRNSDSVQGTKDLLLLYRGAENFNDHTGNYKKGGKVNFTMKYHSGFYKEHYNSIYA